ncbi:MAG: acyltransferase family protein [Acidimicrobiales bacterium]
MTGGAAKPGGSKKPRLDHVDAMRPVKQTGVVTTHTILAFAPAGAALSAGAALMLLHVTREAFLFISACMLTYGYYGLGRGGYRRFYHRRLVSVGLPYVCWTVVYFFVTLPGESLTFGSGTVHFGYLLASGYYQLYYLVVIMQFYAVYPLALWLLRRTEGHHLALLLASAAVQVAFLSCMHWGLLPGALRGFWATREITSYEFYLVAGMIAAGHLDELHGFLVRHWRSVLAGTVVAALVAEAWYLAAARHLVGWAGSGADPLQPIVIPFNVGAIACLYLVGVYFVDRRRPTTVRAMVFSGSDNSYGIYLAQMLFITVLGWLGWHALDGVVPWPLVAAMTVAMVVAACILLTSILARTPLAVALTGRQRAHWDTWLPVGWRRARPAPGHLVGLPMAGPEVQLAGPEPSVAAAPAGR